jgi:hypothetical protein
MLVVENLDNFSYNPETGRLEEICPKCGYEFLYTSSGDFLCKCSVRPKRGQTCDCQDCVQKPEYHSRACKCDDCMREFFTD